jgi:protein tyrosine/serine phosphatase
MSDKLFPPMNFQMVEKNLYRSAFPLEINHTFLRSLKLKTIVILDGECPESLVNFAENDNIKIDFVDSDNTHSIGEQMVTKALEWLVRTEHYPLLVCCHHGRQLTGVVIACLRKLQGWSFISIFEEYRRYAGYQPQQKHEEFVELFDTDLIDIKGQVEKDVETPQFLKHFVTITHDS